MLIQDLRFATRMLWKKPGVTLTAIGVLALSIGAWSIGAVAVFLVARSVGVSLEPLEALFVAGLSGSGRSTAMDALEDAGFYSVDNLPPALVEQFLDLCAKSAVSDVILLTTLPDANLS